MEQSAATRDIPRWVQQWEADRERGFRAYLWRVGLIYFGLPIFTTVAATDYARGTLAQSWFSLILWAVGFGLAIAVASWWWRGAWYDQYRSQRN